MCRKNIYISIINRPVASGLVKKQTSCVGFGQEIDQVGSFFGNWVLFFKNSVKYLKDAQKKNYAEWL